MKNLYNPLLHNFSLHRSCTNIRYLTVYCGFALIFIISRRYGAGGQRQSRQYTSCGLIPSHAEGNGSGRCRACRYEIRYPSIIPFFFCFQTMSRVVNGRQNEKNRRTCGACKSHCRRRPRSPFNPCVCRRNGHGG